MNAVPKNVSIYLGVTFMKRYTLEKRIKDIDEKIEQKVFNGQMLGFIRIAGLIGVGSGLFLVDKNTIVTGAVFTIGSSILKLINDMQLTKYDTEAFVLEHKLQHAQDYIKNNSKAVSCDKKLP